MHIPEQPHLFVTRHAILLANVADHAAWISRRKHIVRYVPAVGNEVAGGAIFKRTRCSGNLKVRLGRHLVQRFWLTNIDPSSSVLRIQATVTSSRSNLPTEFAATSKHSWSLEKCNGIFMSESDPDVTAFTMPALSSTFSSKRSCTTSATPMPVALP